MHEIYFYRNRSGVQPVLEYIRKLQNKSDKSSRIKAKKINDYIQLLSEHGTQLGKPYVAHIIGDIWELRPLRDRIFFVGWLNGSFILVHHFFKKTQKTPKREIEEAQRNFKDLMERGKNNEK